MNYRVQELKVGILVVSSFVLLVFFLLVVSKIEFNENKVTYSTSLAYVGGFEVGTPVRLGGMLIGRISGISSPVADSDEIRIEVSVDADAPIKTDSKAYLTSIGLLGEYYLEIIPGSPGAQLLPPGSSIPSMNATTFSQLAMPMAEVAESLTVTIGTLNEMLGGQNQLLMTDLLKNANEMMASNGKELAKLVINLNAMTEKFGSIAANLDTMLVSNDLVVNQMMQNLDSTLAETHSLVRRLGNTFGTLDNMMVDNSQTYQAIIENLARSSRNLEDFSRIIRERPWNLVRKSDPKPRRLPQN